MKNKLIVALTAATLLAGSAYAADRNMFVGLEYGQTSNSTTTDISGAGSASSSTSNNYSDLAFKVGFGHNGDWKMQFKITKTSYDKAIFDSTHKDLTEVGVDFLREFQYTEDAYPFFKFGIGGGTMPVDGYSSSSIQEVSVNAGLGISYQTVQDVYIVGGIDYIYRKWQDINYVILGNTYTRATHDSGVKFYAGVNFQF